MKVRIERPLFGRASILIGESSGSVRERSKHNPRTTNAAAFEPSFSLQPALQLPRCGIPVRQPTADLSRMLIPP